MVGNFAVDTFRFSAGKTNKNDVVGGLPVPLRGALLQYAISVREEQ